MRNTMIILVLTTILFAISGLLSSQTTALSVDTQVTAANVTQGTIKHPLYHFHLTRDGVGTVNLTSVNFSPTGTYQASDITKFQLWSSSTDDISTATQVGSDITQDLGEGVKTFSSFSLFLPASATQYFWITTDISISAVLGRFLSIKLFSVTNFTVSSGTKSGSAVASGAQTFIAFASLGSDYFRSQANGNWGTAGTWQSSHDNVNWATATLSPNSTANTITVTAGNSVTVAAIVTADQVIVNGILIVNAALTVANGPGDDLVINNIMEKPVAGSVSNSAGAVTRFTSGSIYKHLNTTNPGTIPTATWDIDSKCLISGYTSNTTATGGLGQSFGNFEWNCPLQTGNYNAAGNLITINGDFKIANTGIGSFRLSASTSPKLNIGGNFILDNGTFSMVNGSGKPIMRIAGDFVQSGGTLDINRNTTLTWNVTTIMIDGGFYQTGGTITKVVTANSYYGDIILNSSTMSMDYQQLGTITDKVRITKNGSATMNLLSNVSWPSKVTVSAGSIDFGTTPRTMTFTGVADSINFAGSSLNVSGGNARHGIIYAGSTSIITFPDVFTHGTGDYFEFANTGGTQILNLSHAFTKLRINAAAGANIIASNDALSRTITVNDTLQILGGIFTVSGSASSATNYLVCHGSYLQTNGTLELCSSSTSQTEMSLRSSFNLLGGSFKNSASSSSVTFDNPGSECFIRATGYSMSGRIDFSVTGNTIFHFYDSASLLQNSDANCTFTMQPNATLVIQHPQGIAQTGSTGCIQVGGTRSFSSTGTYRYFGTMDKVTGTGLTSCRTLITDTLGEVTLTSNVSISQELILSQGNFKNESTTPNVTLADDSVIYRHFGTISHPPFISGSVSNFYYESCTTGTELTNLVDDLVLDTGGTSVTLDKNVTVERLLNLRTGSFNIGSNTLNIAGITNYLSGNLVGGANSNIIISGADLGGRATLYAITLNDLTITRTTGFQMLGNIQIEGDVSIASGCEQHTDLSYHLQLNNTGSTLYGSGYWFGTVVKDIADWGFHSNPLGIDIVPGIQINGFTVTQKQEELVQGSDNSIMRRWNISGTPATIVTLSLIWPSSADNGLDFNTYDAQIWRNSGNGWMRYGAIQSASTDPRQVTILTDTFSEWTVATEDQTLPVELSSFLVTINSNHLVQLHWVTQSETNVSGYLIYRSNSASIDDAICLNVFIPATNTSQTQSYMYVDNDISEPGIYYYWLEHIDFDGSNALHGPVHVVYEISNPETPSIPVIEGLNTYYPNPFNPSVAIKYGVVGDSDVEIGIYNIKGQLIKYLMRESKKAGAYSIIWNGIDESGKQVSSGIYLLKMQIGKKHWIAKLILSK